MSSSIINRNKRKIPVFKRAIAQLIFASLIKERSYIWGSFIKIQLTERSESTVLSVANLIIASAKIFKMNPRIIKYF